MLLAVFAINMVSSSVAYAGPPEFLVCEALVGGLWKDAKCENAGPPFSFIIVKLAPGAKVALTLKGGASEIETAAGEIVKCTANTGTGTARGEKKAEKVFLTFTGCELKGAKCTSAGKLEGEVATSELEGPLIYLKKKIVGEARKVGLSLTPKAQPFATFTCGAVKVTIKGSIIGEITPVQKITTSFTVAWEKVAGKKGLQKWRQVEEEGPIFALETEIGEAKAEESALEASDSITFESGKELGVGEGESPCA